ncbi:MAG: type 4a pilus biogenesis protein PilO [Candidatus Eisenbacteria bacterium]
MRGRVRLDLIVAVAILLGLVVANATVYAPKRRQLDDVTGNLKRAEQELRYFAGHSGALAEVEEYLPTQAESGDHRFLSGVSAELDRLGIALLRVEPQAETPYGAYVQRTYKLQLEGSYKGFSSFLEYLEHMSDVVIVEDLDFKSSALSTGSKHMGSLTVSVIGY